MRLTAAVVTILAVATASCGFGQQRSVAVLGADAPAPSECRELGGGWAWEGSEQRDGTVMTVALSSPASRGLEIGHRQGLRQRRDAGWTGERMAALDYLGWSYEDSQAMHDFAGTEAQYDALVTDITRRLAAAQVCPRPWPIGGL